MNLGEIQYLGVPYIIDYKLVRDSKIQNDGSNRLDEVDRKLVVTDLELQTYKNTVKFWSGKITDSDGNVSFFFV